MRIMCLKQCDGTADGTALRLPTSRESPHRTIDAVGRLPSAIHVRSRRSEEMACGSRDRHYFSGHQLVMERRSAIIDDCSGISCERCSCLASDARRLNLAANFEASTSSSSGVRFSRDASTYRVHELSASIELYGHRACRLLLESSHDRLHQRAAVSAARVDADSWTRVSNCSHCRTSAAL